jgi:ketosteroid isomerase-like protein
VWDATEGGSQVALELGWSAIAACEMGLVSKGQKAEARIALFIKFKNQKIVRLRTYLAIAPAGNDDLAWPETEGPSTTSPASNETDPSTPRRGMNAGSNFDIARLYLAALSEGLGPEAIARFFSTDAVCEVLPSALNPRGERWDLEGIKAARKSSLARFASQEYELRGAAGGGSNVAMEVHWTGRLGVASATHASGRTLEARSAVFLKFRDGLIVRQRNYDAVGPILIAPESTAAVS